MSRRIRIPLPHGETDSEKTYSMPDPDELMDDYDEVRQLAWPWFPKAGADPVTIDREQLRRVLELADGYLTLTMGYGGQERMAGKLRDIWRARRARSEGER